MEHSKMIKKLIAITSVLMLAGCATMDISPETKTLVLTRCPVLKQYSPQQLAKAAIELKNLSYSDSEIEEMINDYGKLRKACKVITKKLKQLD